MSANYGKLVGPPEKSGGLFFSRGGPEEEHPGAGKGAAEGEAGSRRPNQGRAYTPIFGYRTPKHWPLQLFCFPFPADWCWLLLQLEDR